MAQLHVLNVTTTFVQTAVVEHSTKFELSNDGRKIRWRTKSNQSATAIASPDPRSHDEPSTYLLSSRKRPPYEDEHLDLPASKKLASTVLFSVARAAYKPTSSQVFRCDDSDSSIIASDGDEASTDACNVVGKQSLNTSVSRIRDALARLQDGPMIFYSNASFCTDLSGHASSPLKKPTCVDPKARMSRPLGLPAPYRPALRRTPSNEKPTEVLRAILKPSSVLEIMSSTLDIQFPDQRLSFKQVSFAEPDEPIPLEASGFGGVTPPDNLAITVLRQRARSRSIRSAPNPTSKRHMSMVLSSLPISSQPQSQVSECIVSTRTSPIVPSPLPPPAMHFASANTEDYDDDDDSDRGSSTAASDASTTSTDVLRSHFNSLASLQPLAELRSTASPSTRDSSSHPDVLFSNTRDEPFSIADADEVSYSERSEYHGGEDEEDDDNQSVDFLAMARAANPEVICAKEREYDAEMAERLAEDVPAGSSAATAGVGSGFASLCGDEDMDVEEGVDCGASVSS